MATLAMFFKQQQAAKFYAVKYGRVPGIYSTWEECKRQTDQYPNAKFKSCKTNDEAMLFLEEEEENTQLPPEILNEIIPKQTPLQHINPDLSPDQQAVFNSYLVGNNIFMTGPGGTGKSRLIQEIVNHASDNKIKTQVCALTGCAAVLLNCNAKTVHSWAGIGLGRGDEETIIRNICKNKYKRNAWTKIDLLIIDEVSMMSLKLFELLDNVARSARKCRRPFGGLQVIFSGDFYQLPPVGDEDDITTRQFCFESERWRDIFKDQIKLTKIFRQEDPVYIKILNKIRQGKVSPKIIEKLNEQINKPIPATLEITPTKLFPMRYQVDRINTEQMALLDKEDTITYSIQIPGDLPVSNQEKAIRSQTSPEQITREIEQLKTSILGEQTLHLKCGAQVMCVANIDMEGPNPVCNGSQGIIQRFERGLPVVKFMNGHERIIGYHDWISDNIPGIGVRQIPLILAWAITIHKSQGATLDAAEVDIGSGIFESGQTYVALSRIKNLDGLYLKSFNPEKIRVKKVVNQFYDTF